MLNKVMGSLYDNRLALYRISDEKIHDVKIKNFVIMALDHAPEKFWTSPSSGSGKYHPPEDQGNGGLVRHIIKCAYISEELASFFSITDRQRDVVLAGSILHDIQKNGIPWGQKTHNEHGKIAYEWLDRFPLGMPEKDEIRNCVRYHMYRWCMPEDELPRAVQPIISEKIVQLSDFFSSRQCASFLPGIMINEEDIKSYF